MTFPPLRLLVISLFVFLFIPCIFGQVPEHISNRSLYNFLDELANDQVIELISATRPYSREYIAQKLMEAESQAEFLTVRQQHMLRVYLSEFVLETRRAFENRLILVQRDTTVVWSLWPPVLNYRDSLMRLQFKPVYGARFFRNDDHSFRHTWGGIATHAYLGKNISIWASLRDNQQTGFRLARPEYLTQEQGGNYKGITGGGQGGEFSEMRAGMALSWSWGNVGLMKDHLEWGDNYNGSNIFSGRTPSYAMIKLELDPTPWLSFRYHHGWLVSQIIDSLQSYYPHPGDPLKIVYRNKYIAANMVTFTPLKRLNISLGNSIIYSEMNVQPIYMIPFMFFKSAVHTQTSGVRGHNHNSAFFVNVSSRQIKHLHLYGSWFVDEFSKTRVGDDERTNFTSTKGGLRLSNWPVRNVSLTSEYTFTYPKTYQHRTPVTTFETNHFSLGHYLRDNAREIYLALELQPLAGLSLNISYLKAEKGNLRPYIYNPPVRADRDPFMAETVWSNRTIGVKTHYMFFNNFGLFAGFYDSDIRGFDIDDLSAQQYLNRFTPAAFHGKNFTLEMGMQMGF